MTEESLFTKVTEFAIYCFYFSGVYFELFLSHLAIIDYGKFKLKAQLSRCPHARSMYCYIFGNFNISLAEVCLGLAKELWIRIMPDPGVLVRSESVFLKRSDPNIQKG